jgi:hypothetical protein
MIRFMRVEVTACTVAGGCDRRAVDERPGRRTDEFGVARRSSQPTPQHGKPAGADDDIDLEV